MASIPLLPLQVLEGLRVALPARGLTGLPLVGLDEWVAKDPRTQNAFRQLPALWTLLDRVAIHAYRVPTYMKPLNDTIQIKAFADFANVSAPTVPANFQGDRLPLSWKAPRQLAHQPCA